MGDLKGVEAYPLHWPDGWKRTRNPERSRFKTGFGDARQYLFDELSRMGARGIVLSTNVALRNDGMPRANTAPAGGDHGVAVYFERRGKRMVFACDKFDRVYDNMYSIAKTVDALRGIERWGASDMMERAFSGFKQLAAENAGESWWSLLGVEAGASLEEIEAGYRRELKKAHPDTPGGSHEAMQRLNLARDQARAVAR
jgi:hypothetical protein